MTRSPRRFGFTLVELLAVLALLVILGAIAGPSLVGLSGNSKQKAAADKVRGRMADARGRAMSDGTAYRLAIHADGTKIRVAPDGPEFGEAAHAPAADGTPPPLVAEDALDAATAGVSHDSSDEAPMGSANWVTVATYLPDGTCREATATVKVNQTGFPPMLVHLRGLTGVTKVETPRGGGGKP